MSRPSESAKRILFIDDDEDTCEMMRLLLGLSGYEVTATQTLSEGLGLAKRGGFDLYLLDNWLEDGTGIELCRQIRGFDKATPVLFLSAAVYEADVDNAMKAGAQGYLTKPTDATELEHVITGLLERNYKQVKLQLMED